MNKSLAISVTTRPFCLNFCSAFTDSTMAEGRSLKTPSRTFELSGTAKGQVFVDNETLHRMIETFGPLEYSQFMATRHLSQPTFEEMQPEAKMTGNYLLSQMYLASKEKTNDCCNSSQKQESVVEWLERSVEKELEKRRKPSSLTAEQKESLAKVARSVDPAISSLVAKHALNLSNGVVERLAQTSASRLK